MFHPRVPPGRGPSTRTDLQDSQRLTRDPLKIIGGHVQVPQARLGIELDIVCRRARARLAKEHGLGARDDAATHAVPDPLAGPSNPKRPALVRSNRYTRRLPMFQEFHRRRMAGAARSSRATSTRRTRDLIGEYAQADRARPRPPSPPRTLPSGLEPVHAAAALRCPGRGGRRDPGAPRRTGRHAGP